MPTKPSGSPRRWSGWSGECWSATATRSREQRAFRYRHGFGSERVSLVHWAPHTRFVPHVHPGGEEIFVLDGALEDEEGRYAVGSWLRNPAGSQHMPFSLEGCLLYVKIGHLPAVVT